MEESSWITFALISFMVIMIFKNHIRRLISDFINSFQYGKPKTNPIKIAKDQIERILKMSEYDDKFVIQADTNNDQIDSRSRSYFWWNEAKQRIIYESYNPFAFEFLSKYPWIKYNEQKIISDCPSVVEGRIHDQMKVAIEKSEKHGKIKAKLMLEIADLLHQHSNFLTHFSIFTDSTKLERIFIIKELYLTNLSEFGMLPQQKYSEVVDLKEVSKQISSALLFCKKSTRIVFNNISPRNITVSIRHDRHPIYKIADFSEAYLCDDDDEFRVDVKGLGSSLLILMKHLESRKSKGDIHEDTLLSDVIFLAFKDSWNFSIEELCNHPFTWDTKKTLNLFLKSSKLLESNSKQSDCFKQILKINAHEIVSEDWTKCLEKEVTKELNRILREKSSYRFNSVRCEIVDLVKTIRNLYVHSKTQRIEELIGKSDTELCSYWTRKFPQLVLHVFKAFTKTSSNRSI